MDQIRYFQYHHKGIKNNFEELAPTSSSIAVHIKRAYLQCYQWINATYMNIQTLNPLDHGYELQDDLLVPTVVSEPTIPGDFPHPCIDIWSAGCIMAEMLLNRPLFPGTNPINQLECIMSALPAPTASEIDGLCSGYASSAIQRAANRPKRYLRQLLGSASESSISLLEKVLAFNVENRLTAGQCLQHPYHQRYFKSEHLHEHLKCDISHEAIEELSLNEYKTKIFEMIDKGISKGLDVKDFGQVSKVKDNIFKKEEKIECRYKNESKTDSSKSINVAKQSITKRADNNDIIGANSSNSTQNAEASSASAPNVQNSNKCGMWW
ncbi:Mitogen-activated protein kinase 15 [Nymphon striatum]|nr:Mitogen-activated protein kinase 15 [Nymphon striatum]